MEEFLEKLQEDQRRMRKYLRSNALKFQKMGVLLAESRKVRSRIFVIGEPPLDGLAQVIAEEYLTHLPALPIDLNQAAPASVHPDESAEPSVGREAAAKQAGRHLHTGDILLAFLHAGDDRETRLVLEAARAKRVRVLVVGGLGAKSSANKRIAKALLALPTRGVKTVCESSFVCARILARISRASCRDAGVIEEVRLVQATCELCNEQIFFEERQRGKKSTCPLCENTMRVPKDSGRRRRVTGAALDPPPPPKQRIAKSRRKRLKPSVLDMPTLRLEESEDETRAPGYVEESLEAPRGLLSDPPEPPSVEGPSFGSDIVVGSSVVSATPLDSSPGSPLPSDSVEEQVGQDPALTASADPFALEDAFLADLEMPGQPGAATPPPSADETGSRSQRLVSARYSISDCAMRWGRGGYPDEDSPEHEMVNLSAQRLVFFLNPDDPAAATLQQDDEVWVRIEIPAFIEPILVRGALKTIGGANDGHRGARVELEFRDLEPAARRKIERAAENLGAPA